MLSNNRFGSDGRSSATQEAVRAAVGLDLAEDGLDRALALEIELLAPVGRQDAPREVITAAAPAGAWLLASVGVGGDERRDALAAERVDRVVLPVAGVGQHDPRRFADARRLELAQRRLDHRLQVGGVQ